MTRTATKTAKKLKIRRGDLVEVLTGKDVGRRGKVLEVIPTEGRVIVEKINIVKRHTKPRPIQNTSRMGSAGMTPGGVVEKPAPVHVGNVMVVCPVCNRPTRVGMKERESHGELIKVRVCKRVDCGEEIDR
jgi:large subunit ribosomal protein L24